MLGGTMTAGGVQYDITKDRLKLIRAGKFKKIVKTVQQVTFNGQLARRKGQKVTYITDLCVFELTDQGLLLTEIAPGVDLEKDILAHMGFEVVVAPQLKITNPIIYSDRLGLKQQSPWKETADAGQR